MARTRLDNHLPGLVATGTAITTDHHLQARHAASANQSNHHRRVLQRRCLCLLITGVGGCLRCGLPLALEAPLVDSMVLCLVTSPALAEEAACLIGPRRSTDREGVASGAATLVARAVEVTTEEAVGAIMEEAVEAIMEEVITAAAVVLDEEVALLEEAIPRFHSAATTVLAQLTPARNASIPFNSTSPPTRR
jgi:hypothetical protein